MKMVGEIALFAGFLVILAGGLYNIRRLTRSRKALAGTLAKHCAEAVEAKVKCDEWQVKAEYFEARHKELQGVAVERDLFKQKFLEIDAKYRRRSSPRKNGQFTKKVPG